MAAFFPRDRLYNNVAGCCFSERHTTCDKRRCSTRRWRSSPRHRLPPKRLDPLPAACAFSAGNLLCILLQALLCCSPCCIPSCNSRSTRTRLGSTNFDAENVSVLYRYCIGTGVGEHWGYRLHACNRIICRRVRPCPHLSCQRTALIYMGRVDIALLIEPVIFEGDGQAC